MTSQGLKAAHRCASDKETHTAGKVHLKTGRELHGEERESVYGLF